MLIDFADIRDSGQVLDGGSGTGELAFSIARQKPHCQILGIDPSPEFVAFATDRNTFGARISFETGDAQQLRFSNRTFQSSLSLLVFNFIPDYELALRELIRVTKPGGSVSAAVWDYGDGMQMLREFWDAALTVDPSAGNFDEGHMPLCRAGELGDLWKHAGLEEVEERSFNVTMEFSSFADYWDPFLLGQGPAGAYLKRVESARRDALRSEIKRRWAIREEAAPFSLASRAWSVRGII
jgi:SAM-dependent methyltransferase